MAGDTDILESTELHRRIQDIIQQMPSYAGKFDPHAYIDWELKVDKEFDDHDLSQKQMIFIASNLLTEHALLEWKHICRHNKVPQSWEEFKLYFRDAFIPAYYVDHLHAKLDNLKQGDRTVKEYYHDFRICIMFAGLDECMESVMTRFITGLNSEIRTMVMHEAYNHISQLFLLACKAEKEIVLDSSTCIDNMTCSYPFSYTSHADQEQNIVEFAAVLPSSQEELFAEPCDKEELWDRASLIFMPQLAIEPVTSVIEPNIVPENNQVIYIANETEELKLLSSLNSWGYIQFDDHCELSNLENILFGRSIMPCPSHAKFHIVGTYNNNRDQYLVHRVYISSNYLLACSQEEEQFLFPYSLVELSGLYITEHDKTVDLTINHYAKPRTVCCQEGENDENITGSDMTILMAFSSKVKHFHIRITFDTFDELMLHHKVCSFLFSELLSWIKQSVECTWKAWRTKEVDWGPSQYIPNIPNQATMSI